MASYASNTSVSVANSRNELERLLIAHGATGFAAGWDHTEGRSSIMFRIADRMIRFSITSPDPTSEEIRKTPTGRTRTKTQITSTMDQEERRRWRSMLLVTKAKLVAVADGVQTMEEAFMADVVLPDGTTFSEWAAPQLAIAYESGEMPALLPGGRRAIES